jgi:hypothetical protein
VPLCLVTADELAIAHGVDKVRAHSKQWIGAGGLRVAADAQRSALADGISALQPDVAMLTSAAVSVVRMAAALQVRSDVGSIELFIQLFMPPS